MSERPGEGPEKNAGEKLSARELLGMFASFFKIGAFTIGGGYAMLPLIEREFVEARRWVSPEEIVDVFAIAQSLPGVIAVNAAIFVGYRTARLKGALAASAGIILPSFLTILAVAIFLVNMQENVWVQKAFAGVRAGVTAMILLAGIRLGRSILRNPPAWVVASCAFLAMAGFGVSAFLVIPVSAAWGLVFFGLLGGRGAEAAGRAKKQ
ncbi:MAG: chromate transporter [Spirochaetales bacterium]|nr:chromate transporter [Spirochaetales bacterium]